MAIAVGVQVGKAVGELDFFAVEGDGAIGALALGALGLGQVLGVDRQKPAHVGMRELEVPGRTVFAIEVHGAVADVAEDPGEHVEEVHADVGGDAAGLFDVALPTALVPVAAGGDVGDLDLVHALASGLDGLSQRDDAGVQAQLQDVVDACARLCLDLLQTVDVPGIEDQRLFTDGIGAVAQGEPDVGVVQVVGRADADVVDGRAFAAELVDVAVEALGLGEEIRGREVAVDDADAVVGVERGDQLVAGVFDGAHVARRDKAGGADEGEGFGVHLACRCGLWGLGGVL